jgi:O-acetyl-ADP-ribose deacetylase (regulator of RNase III)
MASVKIVLAAVEEALARAWEAFCGDVPDVVVHRGSILDVDCDAVVSPANSFGFMDGGVDALYREFFGSEIQMRVRQAIHERHHGELVVGTAEIVETGHQRIPYLIAAPTMRVPMILRESVNPYLATRAALLLVRFGMLWSGAESGRSIADVVHTVAFPGMGTGVGRVSPAVCARQMGAAIDEVLGWPRAMPRSWAEASEAHQLLYTDQPRRLQHER